MEKASSSMPRRSPVPRILSADEIRKFPGRIRSAKGCSLFVIKKNLHREIEEHIENGILTIGGRKKKANLFTPSISFFLI